MESIRWYVTDIDIVTLTIMVTLSVKLCKAVNRLVFGGTSMSDVLRANDHNTAVKFLDDWTQEVIASVPADQLLIFDVRTGTIGAKKWRKKS